MKKVQSKARHDEAQALGNAERRDAEKERVKWQSVAADKDALIAELEAQLGIRK